MEKSQNELKRERGSYYTPSIWAHRADQVMHHIIDPHCEHHDFHKDALVWDCACGTRNLTNPFHNYKDLYVSTIDPHELAVGKQHDSDCQDAFQYDFLKDDIVSQPQEHLNYDSRYWKMPKSLYLDLVSHSRALVTLWNKNHTSAKLSYNPNPVILYTNPPYGTAGEGKRLSAKSKSGLGKSHHQMTINQIMIQDHLGGSIQQLYVQFYFRAMMLIRSFHLQNAYICFFSTPQFLAGGHYWQKFNELLFNHFKLQSGFMFNSGEFSMTRSDWSIAFLIFKHQLGKSSQIQTLDVEATKSVGSPDSSSLYYSPDHHLEIRSIEKHSFNRISSQDFLYNWARYNNFFINSNISKDRLLSMSKAPEMSTGVTVNHKENPRGLFKPFSLGYLVFSGDNVEDGINGVWITSATAYGANGFNIMPTPECVSRIAVAYASRKVVDRNWIDSKDNFRYPNTHINSYQQFVNDALIFSLFSSGSNQSSLRIPNYSNVGINGIWANKWFWLNPSIVKNILHTYHNSMIKQDFKSYHHKSYIYKMISKKSFNARISSSASDVLKYAKLVWIQSFKYRSVYTKLEHKYGLKQYPHLFINTWDAGWYQIKLLVQNKGIKKLALNDPSVKTDDHGILISYRLFNGYLKQLANTLNKDVYKFGMLGKSDYQKDSSNEITGIQGSLF